MEHAAVKTEDVLTEDVLGAHRLLKSDPPGRETPGKVPFNVFRSYFLWLLPE